MAEPPSPSLEETLAHGAFLQGQDVMLVIPWGVFLKGETRRALIASGAVQNSDGAWTWIGAPLASVDAFVRFLFLHDIETPPIKEKTEEKEEKEEKEKKEEKEEKEEKEDKEGSAARATEINKKIMISIIDCQMNRGTYDQIISGLEREPLRGDEAKTPPASDTKTRERIEEATIPGFIARDDSRFGHGNTLCQNVKLLLDFRLPRSSPLLQLVPIGLLGMGKFGIVLRVYQMPSRRTLALKLMRSSHLREDETSLFVETELSHECEVQKKFARYHVAPDVHSSCDEPVVRIGRADWSWMLMGEVDGSLMAWMQEPRTADELRAMAVALLDLIDRVSYYGFTHRDMHVGNVALRVTKKQDVSKNNGFAVHLFLLDFSGATTTLALPIIDTFEMIMGLSRYPGQKQLKPPPTASDFEIGEWNTAQERKRNYMHAAGILRAYLWNIFGHRFPATTEMVRGKQSLWQSLYHLLANKNWAMSSPPLLPDIWTRDKLSLVWHANDLDAARCLKRFET